MSDQNDDRRCYFCGEDEEVALDDHHVVPRKLNWDGGVDEDALGQTEALCANCHRKLHRLMDPFVEFLSKRVRQRVHDGEEQPGFSPASEL